MAGYDEGYRMGQGDTQSIRGRRDLSNWEEDDPFCKGILDGYDTGYSNEEHKKFISAIAKADAKLDLQQGNPHQIRASYVNNTLYKRSYSATYAYWKKHANK